MDMKKIWASLFIFLKNGSGEQFWKTYACFFKTVLVL